MLTLSLEQPVSKNQGLDIPIESDGKVVNYLSDEVSHTFQSSTHNFKLLTCECL